MIGQQNMFSSGLGNNSRIRRGGENFSSGSIFDVFFKQPFNFYYVASLTSQRSTLAPSSYFNTLVVDGQRWRSLVYVTYVTKLTLTLLSGVHPTPPSVVWPSFFQTDFTKSLPYSSRLGSTYADVLFQKHVDTIPGP
jgi:hypothetical protein